MAWNGCLMTCFVLPSVEFHRSHSPNPDSALAGGWNQHGKFCSGEGFVVLSFQRGPLKAGSLRWGVCSTRHQCLGNRLGVLSCLFAEEQHCCQSRCFRVSECEGDQVSEGLCVAQSLVVRLFDVSSRALLCPLFPWSGVAGDRLASCSGMLVGVVASRSCCDLQPVP